jgi:indole-3-glycerol phosphate synthase
MTAAGVRAQAAEGTLADLQARGRDLPSPPAFAAALRRDTLAVIAEIKRASPTKGDIAPGLDAAAQAVAYAQGGAAAISVLTEPDQFGGSLDDLFNVAQAVTIPVVRKDFIVHAVQIWEARVRGAAAVLLIARGLHPEQLAELYAQAGEASLEVLVEVRDETELARAIALGARVIGVNNRNLETLVIDPTTAPGLMPFIPADRIAIAESGMAEVSDALSAQAAGADALLIGSAISASADPAAAVQAFASLVRRAR